MNRDRQIRVMGIVNLTDDSYFASSRCDGVDSALARVGHMVEQGADIIDIGACSSRPGSRPVGMEVEWSRLEPVLKAIVFRFPSVTLSLDTYHAEVARRAYNLIGNFIVNDISAGEADPEMLDVVGKAGLGYVAMHMRGTSENMQHLTDYNNVVEDVKGYFESFALKASYYGIKEWILDPGFGFAKDMAQNYALLNGLKSIKEVIMADGRSPEVLVGVSRKSMIYKYLDITPEEALPATQVVHLAALQNGADILRVHDVAEALQTIRLYKECFR